MLPIIPSSAKPLEGLSPPACLAQVRRNNARVSPERDGMMVRKNSCSRPPSHSKQSSPASSTVLPAPPPLAQLGRFLFREGSRKAHVGRINSNASGQLRVTSINSDASGKFNVSSINSDATGDVDDMGMRSLGCSDFDMRVTKVRTMPAGVQDREERHACSSPEEEVLRAVYQKQALGMFRDMKKSFSNQMAVVEMQVESLRRDLGAQAKHFQTQVASLQRELSELAQAPGEAAAAAVEPVDMSGLLAQLREHMAQMREELSQMREELSQQIGDVAAGDRGTEAQALAKIQAMKGELSAQVAELSSQMAEDGQVVEALGTRVVELSKLLGDEGHWQQTDAKVAQLRQDVTQLGLNVRRVEVNDASAPTAAKVQALEGQMLRVRYLLESNINMLVRQGSGDSTAPSPRRSGSVGPASPISSRWQGALQGSGDSAAPSPRRSGSGGEASPISSQSVGGGAFDEGRPVLHLNCRQPQIDLGRTPSPLTAARPPSAP